MHLAYYRLARRECNPAGIQAPRPAAETPAPAAIAQASVREDSAAHTRLQAGHYFA